METKKQRDHNKQDMKTQKRLLLIAGAVVLLCALLLWGTLEFVGLFRKDGAAGTPETQQLAVSDYLAQEWESYPLLRQEDGKITVRGDAKITYAQAEKYGAASYDAALLDTYISTASAIAAGLAADCGMSGTSVTIEQYSSDGRVIFTACSDGTITTCWD